MRKKMIIAIIITGMFAAFFIMRGIRAKNIGTISGAEYDYLTIGDYRYERTEDAPVSRADKGKLLGTVTDGDTRFYIYTVKGYDEYLYCRREWEGWTYQLTDTE